MVNFIIYLVIITVYLIFRTKINLHMLQQNFYNENNRYIKWIVKNKKFLCVDIMFLIIILLGVIIDKKIISYGLITFYVIMIINVINYLKKEQVKIPLRYTFRVFRLILTTFGLYFIPIILLAIGYDYVISYLIIGLMISLNSIIVYIANIINIPVEKMVYYGYKNMAYKKIRSFTNLEVVGITGSYGKTSSKNILNTILNERFNSVTTPKNFNTQYGLMITINNYLNKFNEIFIAEMGAFTTGRIKKLCDFVNPKYGILTKIGTSHLETFGSQENIQKTKFELIESLPSDGIGVLNKDDELQVNYKLKNDCKIIWIAINDKTADFYADNIKMTKDGMVFDCFIKKENKSYVFETKLLGNANIYNILSAIALGYELGMNIRELQLGTKKIKTIEHRLELKKYTNNITLIDDAYNSNPVGSKMALDVLNVMDGKKIIVTPGMIELGEDEYKLNKEFGCQIAKVCDEVILVGKKQTKPIQEGLKEAKYDFNKVTIINDVKEAFLIINNYYDEKIYVLLENDLPDIFNERK